MYSFRSFQFIYMVPIQSKGHFMEVFKRNWSNSCYNKSSSVQFGGFQSCDFQRKPVIQSDGVSCLPLLNLGINCILLTLFLHREDFDRFSLLFTHYFITHSEICDHTCSSLLQLLLNCTVLHPS